MQMAISAVAAIFLLVQSAIDLGRASVELPLKGWIQVSEPKAHGEDFRCGAWTRWRANLTLTGESVAAGLSTGGVGDLRPPFPVNGVTTHPRITSLPVSNGWLVSVDDGEFGAAFRWYSHDGKEQRHIAASPVVAFIPDVAASEPETVWLFEGAGHLTKTEGTVSLARRVPAGWTRDVFAKLPGKPHAVAREASGALLIAHDRGVARLTGKRQLEPVVDVELYGLEPSSVQVLPSQEVFVGMRRFVLHIRRNQSRAWYVPAGCERFTAIGPLEPGGADCLCQGWRQPPQGR